MFFIFQHIRIRDAQGTAIGIQELFNVEPIIDNMQRFDQNTEVILTGMVQRIDYDMLEALHHRKMNKQFIIDVRSVVDVLFPASTRTSVLEIEQQNTCIAPRGRPTEPATPAAAHRVLHETER